MRFNGKPRRFSCRLQAILALFVALSFSLPAALAYDGAVDNGVTYEEDGALTQRLSVPLYHWSQPGVAPRGVVLAVHGVVMHGRSFDTLGKTLAQQGFDVYAIDLRGYGRSIVSDHKYCESRHDCRHRVDYDRSYDDMVAVAHELKASYPTLPLFAVGESLGGGMVIRMAAQKPELVNGLILSAPAIKHHSFIDPYLVANGAFWIAKPHTQFDLMPFVRKCASDDPRVIAEMGTDPLLRRTLSAFELMQSSSTVRKTVSYISNIPSDTPVLVIQGSADRCIKADAVMLLLANLRSADQTVKWFHERGHILLETGYVKPDTMNAVLSWLNLHVDSSEIQARRPVQPDIAEKAQRVSIQNVQMPSTMAR
jgi:acylglycerol lipase